MARYTGEWPTSRPRLAYLTGIGSPAPATDPGCVQPAARTDVFLFNAFSNLKSRHLQMVRLSLWFQV